MPSSCSILDKASLEQCSLIDSTPTANKTRPAATERGMPLLQVRDLRTDLLRSASFSLSAGECIAISGPSGSGKTLLLRAIPRPIQRCAMAPQDGSCGGDDRRSILLDDDGAFHVRMHRADVLVGAGLVKDER